MSNCWTTSLMFFPAGSDIAVLRSTSGWEVSLLLDRQSYYNPLCAILTLTISPAIFCSFPPCYFFRKGYDRRPLYLPASHKGIYRRVARIIAVYYVSAVVMVLLQSFSLQIQTAISAKMFSCPKWPRGYAGMDWQKSIPEFVFRA